MSDRVPIFVELCAGTAALSLRLEHPRARPPVSRMGAKTGYADVVLRCMGLRPGQGAHRYLWCEPDAGVRLLLHAYRDRELATAAADIIRGWADEEPRALWERLRAEGPAVCPPVDAREVARFILCQGWTMQPRGTFRHPWGGFSQQGKQGNGCDGLTRNGMMERLSDAPTLPATIADDARKVDPREVARWSWLFAFAYNNLPVWNHGNGLRMGNHRGPGNEWREQEARSKSGECATGVQSPAFMVDRFCALPEMPAGMAEDARAIDPPQLPPGVVVYIDPPYVNCTGYAHAFPRSEWIPVVRRWQEAGAMVVVSEAEPIPDLMADGWHAVRIDGERKGQKRTFSKQQAEWLTMSEPPRWRPSVQMGLWS